MANIVSCRRKRSSDAIYIRQRYTDENGNRRQAKIKCTDDLEARTILPEVIQAEKEGRKYEVQKAAVYRPKGTPKYGRMSDTHKDITVAELIPMYLADAAHSGRFRPNTFDAKNGLARNYIIPIIGNVKIRDITPAFIQDFFSDLPNFQASPGNHTSDPGNVSFRTVEEIRKILSPAFNFAVLTLKAIPSNPVISGITIPRTPFKEREQWRADEYLTAINTVNDLQMKACMAIMAAGTMRSGELLGLRWDCVHLDAAPAYIEVKCELQRLNEKDLNKTPFVPLIAFEPVSPTAKSRLYLMDYTKTKKSFRTIYLPATVATLLSHHRDNQNLLKEYYGPKYSDHNLVFALEDRYPGSPLSSDTLNKRFKTFIEEHNFRPVTFYSLRGTGSSQQMRSTDNPALISANMGGDSERVMMQHYITVETEDRKALAATMDTSLYSRIKIDPPHNLDT